MDDPTLADNQADEALPEDASAGSASSVADYSAALIAARKASIISLPSAPNF